MPEEMILHVTCDNCGNKYEVPRSETRGCPKCGSRRLSIPPDEQKILKREHSFEILKEQFIRAAKKFSAVAEFHEALEILKGVFELQA